MKTRNFATPPLREIDEVGFNDSNNEVMTLECALDAYSNPLHPGKNIFTIFDENDDETTPMVSTIGERKTSDLSAVNLAEQRAQNGQCFVCGQRLFDMIEVPKNYKERSVEPSKFIYNCSEEVSSSLPDNTTDKLGRNDIRRSNRPVPLTIPGLVNRGQCLTCAKTVHQNFDTGLASPDPKMKMKGSFVYTGTYNSKGLRHGKHGTIQWINGDRYVGEFVDGMRHGSGTLTFRNGGGEYVGEFKNDVPHGSGTRRWPNGDLYTGLFVQGKRSGYGRFYFSNGDLYSGEFDSNHFHGFGRYYYNSNKTSLNNDNLLGSTINASRIAFEGYYYKSQRHAKGKVQYDDGSIDIAIYLHDERMFPVIRWSSCRTKAFRIDPISSHTGTYFGSSLLKRKENASSPLLLLGCLTNGCLINTAKATTVSTKSTPITTAEAVSLDYELDAKVEQLDIRI